METKLDPISQGVLRCLDWQSPDDAAELAVWNEVMLFEEKKVGIERVVFCHRIYVEVCKRMGVKWLHLDEFLTN